MRTRVVDWKIRCITGIAALWLSMNAISGAIAQGRPPNVLFIAVDDLRPELGCYGSRHIHSPNIDELAARGVVFRRAYCQYSVCGPSRTSVLTGRRPDSTGVPAVSGTFRRQLPDIVTLPQHFKNHGYTTLAFGKIFHSCFDTAYVGRANDDRASWSEPNWFGSPQYYFTPQGMAAAQELFKAGQIWPHYGRPRQPTDGRNILAQAGASQGDWKEAFVQALATETPDVSDAVPYDGQVNAHAISALRAVKDRPFFLAVGYMKPHLPFVAPRKYWDLYNRERIELPEPAAVPQNAPAVALRGWGELRGQYMDIPKSGPLSDAKARELIHGYYACVSYVDALIGELLAELDRLGLAKNTHVVMWSDHGYHLGEQNHWCKNSNFELSTKVTLIVAAPGKKTKTRCDGIVELVDVFPTLCGLADLPMPLGLEGTSFVPLLEEPDRSWKAAAFSQVSYGATAGSSLRTDRYRLTRWFEQTAPHETTTLELYDYAQHASEVENIAGRPEAAGLVKELSRMLEAGWRAVRP